MAPIHSGANTGVRNLLLMKYSILPKKSPKLEYFKNLCTSHTILNLPELERTSENHLGQFFWPADKETDAQRGQGIDQAPTAG